MWWRMSSENQQEPVILHANAGLEANMNWETYNNKTWKMEQSLFLQSFQTKAVWVVYHLEKMFGCQSWMSALGP